MKLRTRLYAGSAVVLILSGLMAAALLHHAWRGRQLRALANINAQQAETYLQLQGAALALLRDPAPALEELDANSQRLAALDETFAREEEVSGRSAPQLREDHQRIRTLYEKWADAVRAELREGPLPPPTARGLAQRYDQEVIPEVNAAHAHRLEARAANTALNARVVALSTGAALVAPVVCALVLIGLLVRVVAPLGRGLRVLHQGARRIEGGDWEASVPEQGTDELAEAAAAFNRMARAVRESLAEQARLHRESEKASEKQREALEGAVATRTSELQAANAQLTDSLRRLGEAQSQLQLADRLAAVGMLAAGVAHEVNNPLSFVLANLQYAKETVQTPGGPPESEREEVVRALQDALDGAERVRLIVRDLKVFARPDDETVAVNLCEVLRSAHKIAATELRHRATVVEDFAQELPLVRGSGARLVQVFLNLLINAGHAITEGAPDRNTITLRAHRQGDRVVAEVVDTGCGIPPEVIPKIFDPFFTTKPVGLGTGLGLPVCHSIVQGLGGEITVQSRPGETRFIVSLPVATTALPAPAAAPAPTPRRPPAERRRILVVDDEPAIGAATRRLLGAEAEVLFAQSGTEALELLSRGTFDLLLCDVMMPGMNGIELMRAVDQSVAQPRRFAFMTGGALTAEARAFLERTAVPVLHEPFSAEALREVLARSA